MFQLLGRNLNEELVEMMRFQGWEHFFDLPITEFYERLVCTEDEGCVGVQSMILGLIEAQQCATEEVDHLLMLLAQKEAKIALLKVAHMFKGIVGEPGAVLDLQRKNA
ncbi:hypothetical protein HAX54_034970 [Datura stramonium]|uniref:Uncharacterized protein n=1 Tax=Datura stramonium TaxID=4076 RepID=A0ABS8SEP9_DATST|nr:hypothetical protein [Datura stramonium]